MLRCKNLSLLGCKNLLLERTISAPAYLGEHSDDLRLNDGLAAPTARRYGRVGGAGMGGIASRRVEDGRDRAPKR